MNFEDAAEAIDPEIYRRFKQALELGKWPDGRVLSATQKEICIQAVMLYEEKHQVEASQRIGYVDSSKKTSPCDTDSNKESVDNNDVSPLRILH